MLPSGLVTSYMPSLYMYSLVNALKAILDFSYFCPGRPPIISPWASSNTVSLVSGDSPIIAIGGGCPPLANVNSLSFLL